MYNNTIARARKDSQGQRRNCRMSAASQAPHIPRAMRIAERDAEYRQHQSPNRGSQTAQPASSDWHESKNMREGPPSSKESKSPRCNGQHSGCRRRRPMLPYMLPLRQPSLLLLLGWPPVRLVLESGSSPPHGESFSNRWVVRRQSDRSSRRLRNFGNGCTCPLARCWNCNFFTELRRLRCVTFLWKTG